MGFIKFYKPTNMTGWHHSQLELWPVVNFECSFQGWKCSIGKNRKLHSYKYHKLTLFKSYFHFIPTP